MNNAKKMHGEWGAAIAILSNNGQSELFLSMLMTILVSHAEARQWWPIQSPNKGRKKKAKG